MDGLLRLLWQRCWYQIMKPTSWWPDWFSRKEYNSLLYLPMRFVEMQIAGWPQFHHRQARKQRRLRPAKVLETTLFGTKTTKTNGNYCKNHQKSVAKDEVGSSNLPSSSNWMTPPNSNKSMRLANLVGLFYTLKALTWQRFGGLTHHEKSEMKRLKPLQIEVENIKVRRFEPHYLIWRSCWSFLPPGKALNSSVCNEVVWYCKTQYRKRHLLEICQNASFLSTPDKLDKSCV